MSTNTPVWTQSLRQAPGYAPRAAPPAPAYPQFNFTMPSLPAAGSLPGEARAPGYLQRNLIQQQLGNLPGRYRPHIQAAATNLRGALRGYGGWRFRSDNPATAEDESALPPTFDPNAGPGVRERQAVRGARSQAAAAGMLYSTAAEQNIGVALQHVSEEARGLISQYATTVGNILEGWRAESQGLINQWTSLYGDDARWLAENPLPTPLPPAPAPDPAPAPPPPPAPIPQGALPSDPRPPQPGWVQAQPDILSQLAGLPQVEGLPVLGTYAQRPNVQTLMARWPGVELDIRRMGDGRYIVLARGRQTNPGRAAPPAVDPIPRGTNPLSAPSRFA